MKLINVQTNQPIVDFQKDKVVFYSKFLEHEMHSLGIPIPHGLRSLFDGKDCIFLGDKNFQKAFKEVYFLTAMDSQLFEWREG